MWSAGFLALGGVLGGDGPRLPWFERELGLSDVARGELTLDALGCAACHADLERPADRDLAPRAAVGPRLDDVGARLAPDYVARFLAAPQEAHPSTRMPDVLSALAPDTRLAAASALTHFLFQAAPAQAQLDVAPDAWAEGRALFHAVGCVPCHGPLEPPPRALLPLVPPARRPLTHVAEKWTQAGLAAFLFEPLAHRPEGRMPDLGLARGEAAAIAAYLTDRDGAEPSAKPRAAWVVDPALAQRGAELFDTLHCAACHPLDGRARPAPAAPMRTRDLSRGCVPLDSADISANDGEGAAHSGPRYAVDDATRGALVAALAARSSPGAGAPAASELAASALAALDCYACHERDGVGGVPRALAPYLATTEPDLGDEARVPPPLTHVGAKLQADWLRDVLGGDARVRPYMTTRMPRFGEANVGRLADALLQADAGAVPPFEVPVPEGDAARDARDGGRLLLGTSGLGCVTCHDFNGTPSPGFGGLDLITVPERLTPGWYARFLVAPTALRPGIVMPESWPGGVAVHQAILGGDTGAQLRAIWYYLTQGRTADDPEGIRPAPTVLDVVGEARVYRGRSDVAGFRGFAVGSAQGLHYAFDAEVGALAALWRGDFVSVRWDGQGAGDFRPRGEALRMPRDVAFARLADTSAPWPARQRRAKGDEPNPDPTYARDQGYRFRGVNVDPRGVPTFRYMSGAIEVDDCAEVRAVGERLVLRRTFTFQAPAATTLHLRVLAGAVRAVGPDVLAIDGLAVTLPPGTRLTHAPGDAPDAVVILDLPAGVSSFALDHDLQR